jgi:predicted glycoside hydrolase/deacetylase ChbG (UPF0249 family)
MTDTPDRARPRLIITADDLGRDTACTAAIISALERGRITAASIMANGASFEHAVELVHARGLAHAIGVHVVFDEGPPVSDAMRPFCDANGHLAVKRSLKPPPAALRRALEIEVAAQVERVIKAGIRPTHLDSHRHVHTVFSFGRILVDTARRFGIRYVRPARNLVGAQPLTRALYKRLFNGYVRARVTTADYFCDIVDFVERRYPVRAGSLLELMAHLDASERGASNQALIDGPAFDALARDFRIVRHADAGY